MDAMNKFKWTKKEGLSFNKLVLSLPVNVRCSKTDNAEWSVSPVFILWEPGCHSCLNPIEENLGFRLPSIDQWSGCPFLLDHVSLLRDRLKGWTTSDSRELPLKKEIYSETVVVMKWNRLGNLEPTGTCL